MAPCTLAPAAAADGDSLRQRRRLQRRLGRAGPRSGTSSAAATSACSALDLARSASLPGASRMPSEAQLSLGAMLQCRLGLGRAAALATILAAAPQLAFAADGRGLTLLHLAAAKGCARGVLLLLASSSDPAAAAAQADGQGLTPLHLAAGRGQTDSVGLLLQAAPQAALAPELQQGWTPLHWAVAGGHAAAAKLLCSAAPAAAMAEDRLRRNPLHLALCCGRQEVTREVLATGPAAARLTTLLAAGPRALPLFADFIIARPPLSEAEWALVPSPCPALGRALPAALAHSPAQAAHLMAHLPAEDVLRLRTFALCLSRAAGRRRIYLPAPILGHMISLFDS